MSQQMRVSFADDLEARSHTLKIIPTTREPIGNKYGSMKFGKVKLVNLLKRIDLDTLAFSEEKVKAPLMALFDKEHALFGQGSKATIVRAKFSITEEISFDLIDKIDFKTSVQANRLSTKNINRALSSGGTFEAIRDNPDTSFVQAMIKIGAEQIDACKAMLIFQGEGSESVKGMVLCGTDSVTVRTTNNAKKHNALGVELMYREKVIAGLQLPDMHIGPSFILVDNNISLPLNRMSFSVLALILYINENR
jgi:hypothetical protein